MALKSDTGRPQLVAAGAVPVAVLAAAACATAWFDHGSIAPGDWLPYAVLASLLAATVLLSGAAARPPAAALVGLAALAGLAVWEAVSASWAPSPAAARDEALLTLLFAVAVAVPLLAAHRVEARLSALWIAAVAFGGFALLAGADLLVGGDPAGRFFQGRLYFPITYSNAQAALFLAGLWPGVVLAARRGAGVLGRATALGLAAAAAAGAVLAQSKGSLLGLAAAIVVVAVVSPARLRILLAAALALALPLAAASSLTAPFRAPGDAATIRRAGAAVLLVGAGAFALGLVYALLDRRIDLTSRRRAVGRAAGAVALIAAVLGAVAFLLAVGSPTRWVDARWSTFKTYHRETGATHFSNLGSYRYDFWRRSLTLFEQHPIVGCGARCFGPEYLLDRRSPERPQRAHSLYLETAAEDGVVGLALLATGFGGLLLAVGRGARRRRGPAVAALAGATGFLAQCAVDWTWTFPAVGLAYAVLLGVGAADGRGGPLSPRLARPAGVVAVALALAAFAPPWLAARLTHRALTGSPHAQAELRWARRLDPLSTAPVIGQAVTAATVGDELRLLRVAVRREPRIVEPNYFLGVALLNAGRRAQARAQLRRALALDPGNVSVELALARL